MRVLRVLKFEKANCIVWNLDEPEAKELNLALDLIINKEKGNFSCSQALVRLARFYLKNYEVLIKE